MSHELREVQELREVATTSNAEVAKLSERLTKLESELASHIANDVDVNKLLDARDKDDAQYDGFLNLLGRRARIADDIQRLLQTAADEGEFLGGASGPQFAELLRDRLLKGPDPAPKGGFPRTIAHVQETASRIEREDPTQVGTPGLGVRRIAWWRRLNAAAAASVTLLDQFERIDLDAVQRSLERRERARRIVDDEKAELTWERLRRTLVLKSVTGPGGK